MKKVQLLPLLGLAILFASACSEDRENITGNMDGIELDVLTQKGEVDGKLLMCSEKYQLCALKGEQDTNIGSWDFHGTAEADSASCDPATYKSACAEHLLSYTVCDSQDNTINTIACVRGNKSKKTSDFVLNATGECRSFDYKSGDSDVKHIVECITYDSWVNGESDWDLYGTPCDKAGDKTSSYEGTETGKHEHKYVCIRTEQGDKIWYEK